MLTVASPAPSMLNGGQLTDEMGAAGLVTSVRVVGAELVLADLSESDRAAAEGVVANHVPAPPAPDPDEALRQAIASAASWQQLQSALLGTDRPAAVAGRPTGG